MSEHDWYGPFGRRRWKGYVHLLAGLVVVGLALAGFTFERQVIVDGIASPPTRWRNEIQWPPLVFGFVLLLLGTYKARHGDRRE
jgi:hypothetical protein